MSDSAVNANPSSAKCRLSVPPECARKQKGVFVKDPLESDVLFGRGKKTREHRGNKRMRRIVDKHTINYHSQLKAGKKKIAQLVYDEVMKGGTRFLKRVDRPQGWIVVNNLTAMSKISHALRCKKNAHRLISKSEDLVKRFHLENTALPPQSPSSSSKRARANRVESPSPLKSASRYQADMAAHVREVALLGFNPTVATAPPPQEVTPCAPRNSSVDVKRSLALWCGLGVLPNPSSIMIGTQQNNLQELLLRRNMDYIAACQHAPTNPWNPCFPF